jgi:hypothetical protein
LQREAGPGEGAASLFSGRNRAASPLRGQVSLRLASRVSGKQPSASKNKPSDLLTLTQGEPSFRRQASLSASKNKPSDLPTASA